MRIIIHTPRIIGMTDLMIVILGIMMTGITEIIIVRFMTEGMIVMTTMIMRLMAIVLTVEGIMII